jgi:hypothetical protein
MIYSHTQVAESKVKWFYYPSYVILTSELEYEIYLILLMYWETVF